MLGLWAGEISGQIVSGESPVRHSQQYWTPVVANHFPTKSPFIQSVHMANPTHAGYSLLTKGLQSSPPPHTATPLPTNRQRSGGPGGDYTLLPQTPKFEKRLSKKGLKEVM